MSSPSDGAISPPTAQATVSELKEKACEALGLSGDRDALEMVDFFSGTYHGTFPDGEKVVGDTDLQPNQDVLLRHKVRCKVAMQSLPCILRRHAVMQPRNQSGGALGSQGALQGGHACAIAMHSRIPAAQAPSRRCSYATS